MTAKIAELDLTRPLPPELHPKVDHLVTEDDTPVDNIFSEKQQRLLVEPLYSSWPGPGTNCPFVALSNVGMFFAVRQQPQVPDMMLSLDVTVPDDLWPKAHRSYFIWEYGKPPEVVVEIVSNREGGEDTAKLQRYASIGVRYYVIFDPDKHLSPDVLRGFQLDAMRYRPMTLPLWFPGVELGLRLWQGRYETHGDTWLRWVEATGEVIPTGAERAEQEYQRAEQERQRAEQERQRVERLIEQLRRLGVEPE